MSQVPSQPDFQRTQRSFAAHIRDPQHNPGPAGVEDRRMAIYRDLFYNNVAGFIENAYPVLRSISDDSSWHRRVRAFFAQHRCHTPYFIQIADEFLAWLQTERGNHEDDPPFILELAHYEWTELALSVSNADKDLPPVDRNGDLLNGQPMRSPVAWHLAYQYPVQEISAENQPGQTPTFLVVYRDRQDEIHFLQINAVTYRLLELLDDDSSLTGREALLQVCAELRHPDPDSVIAHGESILNDLRKRNIIVGCRV